LLGGAAIQELPDLAEDLAAAAVHLDAVLVARAVVAFAEPGGRGERVLELLQRFLARRRRFVRRLLAVVPRLARPASRGPGVSRGGTRGARTPSPRTRVRFPLGTASRNARICR